MLYIFLAMLESPEEKKKFSELYREYRSRMFSVAHGILRDKHLAEDAVNQAFLKLIKSFKKIEDFSCNQTQDYLVVIVKNVAIDMYNGRRRIVEVSFDEAYDMDNKPMDDPLIEQLGYDALLEVIKQLPEIYCETLYLSSQLGFSVNEIARSLNLSSSAVKQRLMRARQKLSALLEEMKE